MIDPKLTFNCQFTIQSHPTQSERSRSSEHPSSDIESDAFWTGHGIAQAMHGDAGLVGPTPRFEVCGGWLTLLPTEGWNHSLPIRSFADVEHPPERPDAASWIAMMNAAEKEAAKLSISRDHVSYRKALDEARASILRRRGLTRDLASFGLFVGEALGNTLRAGDELHFSRDGNGDFHYDVTRNSETVLSAGSVLRVDRGGPMAVWQQHDQYPNPHAEQVKKQFPNKPVMEWLPVHRPYVSVRIKDQMFQLLDGEEAHIDPYYVYLARSNKRVPVIAFEFTPRAVHAASCLGEVEKELIIDAARTLTAPMVRVL